MIGLKKTKETSNANASVVDGKLVLSFPDAVSPVLWQMDLAGSKASALEVQENIEKSLFTLVLKTPKGESLDIASFSNKNDAMVAFMATSSALENAHGQIRGLHEVVESNVSYTHQRQKKSGAWKKGILAFAGIILVIFLLNIMASQSPRTINASQTNLSQSQAPAPSTSGMPMSADDFLRAQ